MGLPGAGKTTLAIELIKLLDNCDWYNADKIRKNHNDWDFSQAGRLKQASRMRELADRSNSQFVVCDFVAALKQQRDIFNADILIWVDTIKHSKYEDTNNVFEPPNNYNIRVTTQDAEFWAQQIKKCI
jgi:adenylylsulfate kinase